MSILGAICVVLSVILVVNVPAEIPFLRVMALLATVLAVVITALGIARYRADGRQRGVAAAETARRWTSLLVGVLSGAVLLGLAPSVQEFAGPLGEPAATLVKLAIIVAAGTIALIGIWGFARDPGKSEEDT